MPIDINALLKQKPAPKKEPLHKPEADLGSMEIVKAKKKGRPPLGEKAKPGWQRAKEYRDRKRAAAAEK
jgi:hypothetical protein